MDVTEPLELELADFCRAIRDGGEPRSSARIGLDVVQMTEAVDCSLESGGVPLELAQQVSTAA